MTTERFFEIMDSSSGEWEGDNVYKGLNILSKYTDKLIQGTGKNILYSEDVDVLINKGISEEDVKELRRLNWMIEEDTYLACFV